MKAVLGFLLVSVLFISAYAQPGPDTLWTRTWGGAFDEFAASLISVREGGFLAAGSIIQTIDTTHSECAHLVRFSPVGDTLWTNRFCCDTSYVRPAYHSLVQTTAGDFITTVQGDFTAIWYSPTGQVIDTKNYGTRDWNLDTWHSGYIIRVLRPTTTGFFVGHEEGWGVNGSSHFTWLTSHKGNWQFVWHSDSYIAPKCWEVNGLPDSGAVFLSVGSTPAYPVHDNIVAKRWSRPGAPYLNHFCTGHGFALYWEEGHPFNYFYNGGRIVMNSEGEYFIASQRDSNFHHVAVTKLSAAGDSLWTRFFNDSTLASVADACPTPDGGVVVFCTHVHSFLLRKLDAQGNATWQRRYGNDRNRLACAVVYDGSGGYVMLGTEWATDGNKSMIAIRTVPDWSLDTPTSAKQLPAHITLHPAYPNPFNAVTEIAFDLPKAGEVSLRVFDVLGRPVASLRDGRMNAGAQRVSFDGRRLPSGVYFCRLSADNQMRTQKLLLLK